MSGKTPRSGHAESMETKAKAQSTTTHELSTADGRTFTFEDGVYTGDDVACIAAARKQGFKTAPAKSDDAPDSKIGATS